MEPYLDNRVLYFFNNYFVLLSTYICACLIFIKTKSLKLSKKHKNLLIFFIIILPIICQLLGGYKFLILKFTFIILMCISLVIIDIGHPFSSIPVAIISIGISYSLEYLSVIIGALILYIVRYVEGNLLSTIVSCIVQFLLCIVLLRVNKIRKAFTYFSDEKHFGLGLLISSYVLTFSLALTYYKSMSFEEKTVLLLGVPLLLVGLLLWIQNLVELHYKNKIQNRADAFTQQQIADKDEYIQKLETEVATLAKQLHRDNHLLSSLNRSVEALGNNHSETQREQIVEEIHTLFRERNELIAKEQQANKILPSTGIAIIDGALSEMYVKAISHNISFDLMVGEEIHYLVNNIISQTDLQTLLCDHIKDAIIAIDAADNISGKILVSIEKNDGIFEISIRDNGIGFETDTLAKLGLERVTTHAESGGSGIGFVTTFETLQKTKGSLIITEYENKTPFSKCVAFIFDGLHQFIIKSYRKEELQTAVERDDVIFL